MRHIDSFLTCHRIHDEQHFIRLGQLMNLLELIHQRLVNVQTTSRIDNHIIQSVVLGMLHALTSDLHWRSLISQREHRNTDAFAHHLKLLDRSGTVNVARDEQRLMV